MRKAAFLFIATITLPTQVLAQDPCSDPEYLNLRSMSAERMSDEELLRYLELRKKCAEYGQLVSRRQFQYTNPDGPPGTVWFEPRLSFSALDEGGVGISATAFKLGMGLGVALGNVTSIEVGGSFIRDSLKPSGFSAASRNGFLLSFGLRIYDLPNN